MKKRSKIILSLALASLCVGGAATYAYYSTHDDGKAITGTIGITTETIQEVSSYSDLLYYGADPSYNSLDKVSVSSTRTILKLTGDITLADNIVLTRDVHLDLGTHKLNLNDKNLTFKHGYAGCFMLSNGTVEAGTSGTGKIVLDLPYATFETDTVTYTSNSVASTESNIVTIVALDAKYTAYSALYLASNAFESDLNEKPAYKTYAEVSALTSFNPNNFIDEKTCSYNSDTEEACSFVYQDIALMNHYLSTDISITYASSDETILTSEGKVVKSGNVTLTATISKDGWTNQTCQFPIHVVDMSTANAATKNSVGVALLKAYLEDYYVSGDLIIKDQTKLTGYYYRFPHALNLPATALGGSIEYSYSTTDMAGTVNESALIEKNNDAYEFSPSIKDYHLVVKIGDKATSLNMYSTYIGLEETIAYYIVNYLYGGSIVYDRASTEKQLVTLADINGATSGDSSGLYDLKAYLADYTVSAITYTLSGDAADHYEIKNNKLTLIAGQTPEDKEGSVTMSITVNGVKYDIDLNVDYLDSQGTTLASYITYYSIYNAGVPSVLETSFTMPFATNNIAPFTVYDVATYTTSRVGTGANAYTKVTETLSKPRNLKVALWYDGSEQLVFTAYGTPAVSFSAQLDAHLTAKNLTLTALAAKTGDNQAYYKFSIDAQNSLVENQQLVIIYNYKFNANDTEWTRYENASAELTDNNTTYFTVLGGLFYNINGKDATNTVVDYAVKDENFFIWVYNKFKPNLVDKDDNPIYPNISAASSDLIIPVNWLGQSAVITKDDTGLDSVTDFSGIKYLTSVTEADLSDSSVGDNVLSAISEMKSLSKLTLKNCGLTSVTTLSKLKAAGTIKILDISNNNIQYFDGIEEITSLEKVYLYANNAGNTYYGSKGICNYQVYADLMLNGCSVYNDTSSDIPTLYAESNNLDDYRRLKEIAYQNMLKNGKDIQELYKGFKEIGTTISAVSDNNRPTNTNPFGLTKAGSLTWGYQGDGNTDAKETNKYIEANVTVGGTVTESTYYELTNGTYSLTTDTAFVAGKTYYVAATATNATYFYVLYKYSTGEILKVKYYVDRY